MTVSNEQVIQVSQISSFPYQNQLNTEKFKDYNNGQ